MHVLVGIWANINMLSYRQCEDSGSRNCSKWCAKFSYDACAIFNICIRADWPPCKINTSSSSKSWWYAPKAEGEKGKGFCNPGSKVIEMAIYFQGYLVVGRLLLLARWYYLTSKQLFKISNNFVLLSVAEKGSHEVALTSLKTIDICLPPSPPTPELRVEICTTKLQMCNPLKWKLSFDFHVNLNEHFLQKPNRWTDEHLAVPRPDVRHLSFS